ncbi:MAG: hypothetical protein CVU39_23210 [Chloroflexi bacterium HGW-Chloroflexi-10]|nr:MAG: hypothetical protein CVU39_23210 [Chloroflexi bacterium HGW-Chloroflexi-10]
MRIIRRIYFYLVAFISLQVVLWGAINLLNSIIHPVVKGDYTDPLAQGLAQVVVGLPIFLLHWFFIQRDALQSADERDSAFRALFFYALRLTTWIVSTLHLFSLGSELVFRLSNLPNVQRMFFPDNDIWKNLITIAANLLVWGIFERFLRRAWQPQEEQQDFDFLIQFRRLFLYLWSSFNLIFWVMGVANLIQFMIAIPQGFKNLYHLEFGNGLTLLLVSAPLWILAERHLAHRLTNPEEKQAVTRKIFIYLTVFILLGITLGNLGYLLNKVFNNLFNQPEWLNFTNQNGMEIGLMLVCAVVWYYFSLHLKQVFEDAKPGLEQNNLKRLYWYILSAAGTGTTLAGTWLLIIEIIRLFYRGKYFDYDWGNAFSSILPLLLIGLPLWLIPWQKITTLYKTNLQHSNQEFQSLLRRIYLYIFVFATIIASMTTASIFIYEIIKAITAGTLRILDFEHVKNFFVVLVNLGWFIYHQRLLRVDNQKSNLDNQKRQELFPVLFVENEASTRGAFVTALFQKQAAHIPVQATTLAELSKTNNSPSAKVLILSAESYQESSPESREWLRQYTGQLILLPFPFENIHWAGLEDEKEQVILTAAVKKAVKLSEGNLSENNQKSNPWAIVGYIFIGLVALIITINLISKFF